MGRKLIDWEALRIDYMKNNYADLKEFADHHKLNYGTVRNRCAGFADEKTRYKGKVSDLALVRSQENDVMTTAQRNLYHVELWDRFLSVVSDALQCDSTIKTSDGGYRVGTIERLSNILEKAQKGQRLALGMDKETKDTKNLLGEISAAICAAKSIYGDDQDEIITETT